MKRREFLQKAALTSAGIAAYSSTDRAAAARMRDETQIDPSDLAWSKAPCRFCGTGCGVEVGTKGGRVLAVRGDRHNPVNRGMLCVKGYHLPGFLYGEDRLTTPLRRRADGSFEAINWDDALDMIADRFTKVLKEHGPEAVAMYGSGQWGVHDGYAALKWVKAGMRSNNLEGNARLCMASAVMGFMTQFQSDEPMGCYEDFEAGDDFVLWGNNMAEMHPVLFSRILENKRDNGLM